MTTHLQRRRASDRSMACDHFTTLDTLTMKVLAADRQDWPASTAATTRSRRSNE
jgi:hypothetical protein